MAKILFIGAMMILFGLCIVGGLLCVDARRVQPVWFLVLAVLFFAAALSVAAGTVGLMGE